MFDIRENLKKLPDKPGVYMHKDKLGQVIYVGKAISLKNRVRQYFQSSSSQSSKVRSMVSNICEFEYITCETEMEALILECNLIKKYEPKYNVLLRDDKTYPYIKVTMKEDYPRIIKTRRVEKDGSKYFGPYSDVGAVNHIIQVLNKTYALKRCNAKAFPKDYTPCLNYHINECMGICTGKISKEEYMASVDEAVEFLGGKHTKVIESLKARMNDASEKLDFEKAAFYRDSINAVNALAETQRVTIVGGKDMDMVLPIGQGDTSAIVLFSVRNGKLSSRETFDMQSDGEDDYNTRVSQFIKQYYSQWALLPNEIIIEKKLEETELIESYLSEINGGRKVKLTVPQKGDKKALLDLAKADVVEMAKTLDAKVQSAREKDQAISKVISELLGNSDSQGNRSYRIESYDISNTNGVDTVGAMVVFNNLKPIKKDYRRFKIKSVEGPDDYGSLEEMLRRRFTRAKEGDPGFVHLPDLIMMDGGQGQVSSAEKVLIELGLHIPVLGMAKDDKHRTRALVNGTGQEMILKDKPLLYKYCGTIQEEVHRFAIEYHRKLHKKNTINSLLDNIEGIGPAKRTALLKHFDSIDEIKKASVERLMEVRGITPNNALKIKDFFS